MESSAPLPWNPASTSMAEYDAANSGSPEGLDQPSAPLFPPNDIVPSQWVSNASSPDAQLASLTDTLSDDSISQPRADPDDTSTGAPSPAPSFAPDLALAQFGADWTLPSGLAVYSPMTGRRISVTLGVAGLMLDDAPACNTAEEQGECRTRHKRLASTPTACAFCKRRKIACGGPLPSDEARRCG